jgi:nicotinate-nucleotide adenylyltransferase
MVAIACLSAERFSASDIELRTGEPSYTVDTLRRLQARGHRPQQLFFITGADAFAEIETWHQYPQVLAEANFVVVSRPNYEVSDLRTRLPHLANRMITVPVHPTADIAGKQPVAPQPATLPVFLVEAPTSDVSSTEIRRRLAGGESITGLVLPNVETHIRQHALYQAVPLHGEKRPIT